MLIRPYQPADLDATVRLWYETWHQTFPALRHPQSFEEFRLRFRDSIVPNESVLVAEMDGQVVGSLAVDVASGYLDQLFVDPRAQGHSVGSASMAKAKELAPEGLFLHTLEQNVRARAFWERHSFERGAAGVNPINGQRNLEYRWQPSAPSVR